MEERELIKQLEEFGKDVTPSKQLMRSILAEAPKKPLGLVPTGWVVSPWKIALVPLALALLLVVGISFDGGSIELEFSPEVEIFAMELDELLFEEQFEEASWLALEEEISLDLLEIEMVL